MENNTVIERTVAKYRDLPASKLAILLLESKQNNWRQKGNYTKQITCLNGVIEKWKKKCAALRSQIAKLQSRRFTDLVGEMDIPIGDHDYRMLYLNKLLHPKDAKSMPLKSRMMVVRELRKEMEYMDKKNGKKPATEPKPAAEKKPAGRRAPDITVPSEMESLI